MLDVNYADDAIAGDDGGREEGFVLVFGKLGEGFEAGIEKGLFADGDETALAGDPASEAFVDAEAQSTEGAGRRIIGRAEEKVSLVEEVKETRIAAHKFKHESVDRGEDLLEAELLRHQAADLLEQPELLLGPVQLGFQFFYLGHSFIMAGQFR